MGDELMPLAYYSRAATQEFWSEHWRNQDPETLLRVARRSPLTLLIERALPRNGHILEAGCGLGQYVVLLRERGYTAMGVDWSLEALRRCRKAMPATPVAVTDLGALGVKDAVVAAYVSLGVVEHDPKGPDRILEEAHRVLAPGGSLLLSVPYLNGGRCLLRPYLARRQTRIRGEGGEFYQYAFTRREVRALLQARGFSIRSLTPYDPARHLRKVLRQVGWPRTGGDAGVGDRGRLSILRLGRAALYTSPMLRLLGHMILAVAVKQ